MTTRIFLLGKALQAEGRLDDAVTVFEHLLSQNAGQPDVVRALVRALGDQGQTLAALERLNALTTVHANLPGMTEDIQALATPAAMKFNLHLQRGETDAAERFAAALAAAIPRNRAMVAAALSCNQTLGRPEAVRRYANQLLALDPGDLTAHAALLELAKTTGDLPGEIRHRTALALSDANADHPMLRLRDIHDVVSLILCEPLTEASEALLQVLLDAAAALNVQTEPGSEWEAWEAHYRLLLEAIDLGAIRTPAPEAPAAPTSALVTSAGKALDWKTLRKTAERLGAQAVFFAAADETYVDQYARWYALSVLKYADVPCLVVIHVIGGAGRLARIAAGVGVNDERLVFCGDTFDAAAVTTQVWDAPPKGLIARPVAHFQSVRFLELPGLTRALNLPVFVSDIDLLLQRGVADLLARTADADLVLNENLATTSAGSRLTANLLQVNPTEAGIAFAGFLRAYLADRLARPQVSRWIDQAALTLARRHLERQWPDAKIAYFDTDSDINNVMYPSYQDHPFRFLSLFHGFDTSSLEGNERAGAETKPTKAKRARRSAA